MADNVTIPASGTGTATPVVATDDVGGVHYQRMKLVGGADGAATRLDFLEDDAHNTADPGIQMLAVRTATPTNRSGTDGDYEPLQVSAGALWVRPTTTIIRCQTDVARPANTTVYAAGDAIADTTPTAGGFTFTSAARVSGGSGIIIAATFSTDADPATRLSGELFIFDQSVTAVADNAAFVVSDAEIKTLCGVVPFSMFDAGNNGFCSVTNIAIPFVCVGTANLRFLLRARNAYTPVSGEIITVTIYIQPGD